MIKMTGIIRVKKRNVDNKTTLMTFVDILDDESYKVAKNHNWDQLCKHEFELIEAWGRVYYEYNGKHTGRYKVFYIKEFAVSGRVNENFETDHFSDDDQSKGSEKLIKNVEDESA